MHWRIELSLVVVVVVVVDRPVREERVVVLQVQVLLEPSLRRLLAARSIRKSRYRKR